MLKKLHFSIVLCAMTMLGFAQNVNIPDANFKACLLANTSINTNGDSEIQVSEASAYVNPIACVGMGITDLTGIEAFTNLNNTVNFSNNSISTLDLSNSPNLIKVFCNNCNISDAGLNLAGLTALETITLPGNNITSFDASLFPNLESLGLSNNPINTLNLNGSSNITNLSLTGTNLSTIDLSSLINLEIFSMQQVDISQINFSSNTSIRILSLSEIGLTTLDLGNHPELISLSLEQASMLTSVDVSQSPLLESLSLNNSVLLENISISSANSNNIGITFLNITNTAVSCLEVDATVDPNNPPSNWFKDSSTVYSYDCNALSISESEISKIKIYPNPFISELSIGGLVDFIGIKVYDLHGKLLLTSTRNSIDTNALSSGMYLVTVEIAKGKISKKLIKQ